MAIDDIVDILGYWCDPTGRSSYPLVWPDPSALPACSLSKGERERLCAYLRAGEVAVQWMGYSWCRFEGCPIPMTEMGTRDLSDGVWRWPEGLVHYVEHHEVALPKSFVDHALGLRAHVPSGRAWADWCAEQTPAPSADADALSLAQACGLASSLLPGATLHEIAGRWCLQHGARVDYLPQLAEPRLEAYLHMHRTFGPVLSLDEANALIRSELRPSLWSRLTGKYRLRLQGAGPNWLAKAPHGWNGLRPLDETALRYALRLVETQGDNLGSAAAENYRRHFAR